MAEQVLSQDEVDLLLKSLGKEEEEKPEETSEGIKYKKFDIGELERISLGRIAGLEIIFERWARALRGALSNLVVSINNVIKEETSVMKFSELMKKLPIPSCINIFTISKLKGSHLLILDPRMIYSIISVIFGGPAKPYKIEGKDFTKLELKIIKRVVSIMLNEFQKAWSLLLDGDVNYVETEANPALITIASPKETFIVTKIIVDIEGIEFENMLALSDASLSPIKETLRNVTEVGYEKGEEEKTLIKDIIDIPVLLSVHLDGTSVLVKDVLNWEENDTIILSNYTFNPVEIRVEGVPKFEGIIGKTKDKKSVKIVREIKD